MRLFALYDQNPKGCIEITKDQVKEYNDRKYGIFYAVNHIEGDRRKENVKKINAWYVDLDNGDKAEFQKWIKECPIMPSVVVETKRGYHVLFFAENATVERFKTIQKGLQYYFRAKDRHGVEIKNEHGYIGADPCTSDISRLLRYPNTYHWKDETNPFFVKLIHNTKIKRTEDLMMTYFPGYTTKIHGNTDENREKIDTKEAFSRLSGTDFVNGDVFTFRENANGTAQIRVNGKEYGAFIDQQGFIGSYRGDGPTLYQYLKVWYNTPWNQFKAKMLEWSDLKLGLKEFTK